MKTISENELAYLLAVKERWEEIVNELPHDRTLAWQLFNRNGLLLEQKIQVIKRRNYWVNKSVTYVSRSGYVYGALITTIPENPGHAYTDLPTVSLEFRDKRGKLVRKKRVLPACSSFTTCVWKPKIQSK